ncbi:MAG: 16S rRNA (guanine(527)-N(7))-methyltransferase RsmG [Phycisphaerae bacterium]
METHDAHALWNTLAADAGVALSAAQLAALARYLDLLIDANARMNLTRIVDRPSAEVRHVADALTLLRHLPVAAQSLVDVGTGGGVPGIPLAVARPDVAVTLVDATGKKCDFLRHAAAELGLNNVTVVHGRAETLGHGPLRASFDVAVARAVAHTAFLAEWLLPLVKPNGRALLMKGPKHAEELPEAAHALRLCGADVPHVDPVTTLPGVQGQVVVVLHKTRGTDYTLPRDPTRARGKRL